jgi:hypothetical protein
MCDSALEAAYEFLRLKWPQDVRVHEHLPSFVVRWLATLEDAGIPMMYRALKSKILDPFCQLVLLGRVLVELDRPSEAVPPKELHRRVCVSRRREAKMANESVVCSVDVHPAGVVSDLDTRRSAFSPGMCLPLTELLPMMELPFKDNPPVRHFRIGRV